MLPFLGTWSKNMQSLYEYNFIIIHIEHFVVLEPQYPAIDCTKLLTYIASPIDGIRGLKL